MDNDVKDALIDALTKIQNGDILLRTDGICANVTSHIYCARRTIDLAFMGLVKTLLCELFIGLQLDATYPIPDFGYHRVNGTLWIGDQYDKRMTLVAQLLESLKNAK